MSIQRIRGIYYLLTGTFWFSTALLAPLYVLYLMERGMNLGQIGLWAGANTVAVILLEIPTGGLADTWGRGRTYSAANLVIAFSLLLMVFVPGTAVLYVGAAVFGSGRALSSGSLDAWFIDSLKTANPDTDTEKELAPAGGIQLLALAFGCILGAMLPTLVSDSFIPGYPVLALPLLADAMIKILIAFLTGILIREPGTHDSPIRALKESIKAAPDLFASVHRHVLKRKQLLVLFLAGAFLCLIVGSLETLWQPRFSELSGRTSGIQFGFIMAGGFFAGALCSFLVPKVTALFKGRRYWTAFVFSLMSALAVLLISYADSSISMALSLALVYFLTEGVGVPRKALLNDLVPAEIRATALSVDSLVSYLGFAGIIGLGYLAESQGIPFTWRVVAYIVFPASLLYLLFSKR